MFLHRTTTRILKKAAAVALTAVTAFSALALFPEEAMQKAEAVIKTTKTVPDGIYYFRNLHSGLYMDMYNNWNYDGNRVIQYPFHGAMNQRFKVVYRTNSLGESYYTIHPMNAPNLSKAFDLASKSASCTNGTDLQIYSHNSDGFAEQRFMIKQAVGGGYQIGTWASNGDKVLEVTDSSTAPHAQIQIWSFSTTRNNDNWDLEPAPTGFAYHVVTNDISNSNLNKTRQISDRAIDLGFTSRYGHISNKTKIKDDAANSSVLVIHGHGEPGGVVTDVDNGYIVPCQKNSGTMYPTDTKLSTIINRTTTNFPTNNAKHLQLVYFASCHSAASKPLYNNKSMIQAAIDSGARCAIGFVNTVTGAEDYLRHMINYIYSNKYATVQQAMNYADSQYSASQKSKSDCPANTANRQWLGNTGVIIDLRLP